MSEQRNLPQEAGYNLRRRHPDFADHLAVWEAESRRVREALACTLDVRYGAGPNMTADLFPAPAPGAPIQVFIHGGYWRAMDKDVHSFPAEGFVAAGGHEALGGKRVHVLVHGAPVAAVDEDLDRRAGRRRREQVGGHVGARAVAHVESAGEGLAHAPALRLPHRQVVREVGVAPAKVVARFLGKVPLLTHARAPVIRPSSPQHPGLTAPCSHCRAWTDGNRRRAA